MSSTSSLADMFSVATYDIFIPPGTFYFSTLSLSGTYRISGPGTLRGNTPAGSAPSVATLRATNSAGRLAALQTEYAGEINLPAEFEIEGKLRLTDALIHSSSQNFVLNGRFIGNNVSFHGTNIMMESGNSAISNYSSVCDSSSTSVYATGGKLSAPSMNVIASGVRGLQTYGDAVIDANSGGVYDAVGASVYGQFKGFIVITSATLENSGAEHILTNYGSVIDASNATLTDAGTTAVSAERGCVVYIPNGTIDTTTTDAIFCVGGGVVNAQNITMVDIGRYAAFCNDGGHIDMSVDPTLDGSTITGDSSLYIRATGEGHINFDLNGSNITNMTEANLSPGFNRVGNGAAYIGLASADDAQVTVGAMRYTATPPTATISSGSVAITSTRQKIDTEGLASTDDLATVELTSAVDMSLISAASGTRDVVVKHGSGNIITSTGADITLDDADKVVMLVKGASNWRAQLIA